MLYNSKEFAIFFLLIFIAYLAIPHKYRKALLIPASYYFYAHFDVFLLVLLFCVSSFCYLSSKFLLKVEKLRNPLFFLSLIIIFCPLLYFKYLNFILDSLNSCFSTEFSIKEIMLPVGISFFTFQAAGYLIDVYKKKISPAENLFDFLLFISFFPQLVAGPIERAQNLLPQLKDLSLKFDYKSFTSAFKLIAWGFFKKIVIADRIASLVDPVYSNPSEYNSLTLIVATFLFGYQIYCDFSGYSDIAKGLAKLFGIELMLNFKQPYLSKSIIEFWKRWHISLSTWFKDYVFIPLGGSRVSQAKFIRNIFIVFMVSGIWHGANWTFVVWGLIHSIFYIAAKYISLDSLKIPDFIKIIFTFIIANLAWLFFRADSVQSGFAIIHRIVNTISDLQFHVDIKLFSIAFVLILVLEFLSSKANDLGYPTILDSQSLIFRWFLYFTLILSIVFLGEFNESSFIYFKF